MNLKDGKILQIKTVNKRVIMRAKTKQKSVQKLCASLALRGVQQPHYKTAKEMGSCIIIVCRFAMRQALCEMTWRFLNTK